MYDGVIIYRMILFSCLDLLWQWFQYNNNIHMFALKNLGKSVTLSLKCVTMATFVKNNKNIILNHILLENCSNDYPYKRNLYQFYRSKTRKLSYHSSPIPTSFFISHILEQFYWIFYSSKLSIFVFFLQFWMCQAYLQLSIL